MGACGRVAQFYGVDWVGQEEPQKMLLDGPVRAEVHGGPKKPSEQEHLMTS